MASLSLSSLLFLFLLLAHQHDAQETTTSERVVTAHPLATAAGARVLEQGGTAVDAMIAVQTVLGLVEPQSSGIGGGAFVVYYDAETETLTTFDARETAPATATETRFQQNGASLGLVAAWQSGLSVGVPGVPRLMEDMHQTYGKLPWVNLFWDAKAIATDGFSVTQRMVDGANLLLSFNPSCEARTFFRDPEAFAYFLNEDCTPKPVGTLLKNPAYAATMQLLADEGADGFYTGPLAERMVAKIANDINPTGDPTLTMDDFLNYKVIEREPVCQVYRDNYNICGMGPPSSGALAVGQIFGILDNFDLSDYDVQDVETVHLFTQAMRLAFADRALYVGDSDFVTVPVEGMLDSDYLTARAALINMTADMGTAEAGKILNVERRSRQTTDDENGTSHLSIVDQYGNALSMTTTVEGFYGNGLMVDGFLLNNQLTDFSFAPVGPDGTPIANRVQANKRPRSSMSPTIVLDAETNAVTYLTGSPGGSRIIGYTAQSLLSMIDFGFDPQTAVGIPHYQNRNGDTTLEANQPNITTLDYDMDALTAALEAMGHVVSSTGGEGSGLSVIQVVDGEYLGGVDPRRDGTVGGRDVIPIEISSVGFCSTRAVAFYFGLLFVILLQ